MAIERLEFIQKQEQLVKASELSARSTELFKQGQPEDAINLSRQAIDEAEKLNRIHEIYSNFLRELSDAGLEQLPAEYVTEEVATQPEMPIPPTEIPPEPEIPPVAGPKPEVSKDQEKDTFADLPMDKFVGIQHQVLEQAVAGIVGSNSPTIEAVAQVTHAEKIANNKIDLPRAVKSLAANMSLLNSKLWDNGSNIRVKVIDSKVVLIREGQPKPDQKTQDSIQPAATESETTLATLEVEEPLTLQLSGAEMYRLGQLFDQTADEKLARVGIRLPAEDREAVSEILGRLSSFVDVVENAEGSTETLSKKLTAFVKDKQTVFMANMEDEDAQFLLTFLAGIESGDQIRQLIGTTSKSGKKETASNISA